MLVKYFIDDEVFISDFCSVSFEDGILTFIPKNHRCLNVCIDGLSPAIILFSLDLLYENGKIDFTHYEHHAYYDIPF